MLPHLPSQRIITYHTPKELAETLPQFSFLRGRKLFIISLNYVRLIDGNLLYTQDKLIPASGTYREALYRVVRGW